MAYQDAMHSRRTEIHDAMAREAAEAGLCEATDGLRQAYRPHWSADVLAELSRNLVHHAGLSQEKAAHRIDQMEQALPDVSVTGYDGLIDGLRCDPKDRPVLAAAIHGGCQVIVTFNTKDFPPEIG